MAEFKHGASKNNPLIIQCSLINYNTLGGEYISSHAKNFDCNYSKNSGWNDFPEKNKKQKGIKRKLKENVHYISYLMGGIANKI